MVVEREPGGNLPQPQNASEQADAAIGRMKPQALALVPSLGPRGMASRIDDSMRLLAAYGINLSLPPRLNDDNSAKVLESSAIREARAGLSEGIDALAGLATSRTKISPERFQPNRVASSLFRKQDGSELIDTKKDLAFKNFLEGKSATYSGRGKEICSWISENRQMLEKSGIKVSIAGVDSFTLTNEDFKPAYVGGIIGGNEFQSFLAGNFPIYSGNNGAIAKWLSDNASFLAENNVEVLVVGNTFTLRNLGFRIYKTDPTVFSGSGLGGSDFDSFVDGFSPALEGNDLQIAKWIYAHQQELADSSIQFYVALNPKGEPTGRFTLQNSGFLPPSMKEPQRDALVRAVSTAKKEMDEAERNFRIAESLRSSGDADEVEKAKGYVALGLTHLDRAQKIFGAASACIENWRILYAKRNEIDSLPKAERDAILSETSTASTLFSKDVSGDVTLQIDNMRRSAFLLQHVETELYLKNAEGFLPAKTISDIRGYLKSAMDLFDKQKPAALEQASFILSQTHSLITISIERAAVSAQLDDSKKISVYIDVKKLAIFQKDGKFDESRFMELSGVSYDEYVRGKNGVNRGFATLLSNIYADSLAHYDKSISGIKGLIDYAKENGSPEMSKVEEMMKANKDEHDLGVVSMMRSARVDPLIQAFRGLESTLARLPSDKDIDGLHLGQDGASELLDSRNDATSAYRRLYETLGTGFLALLGAQNSQGSDREDLESTARTALAKAHRQNKIFTDSANTYNSMYSKTSAVVSYVQSTEYSGEIAAASGEDLLIAAKKHLQDIQRDPNLSRPYFLQAVTDPNFLPNLPHKEDLLSNINYLGGGNKEGGLAILRVLYDPMASPEQIKAALDTLAKGSAYVMRRQAVMTGRERGQIWKWEDVRTSVTFEEGIYEENRDLAIRYFALKANPAKASLEERREVILQIIKRSGDKNVTRALDSIEKYVKEQFVDYYEHHIRSLYEEAQTMAPTARALQVDTRLLLSLIKPSEIVLTKKDGKNVLSFKSQQAQETYERMLKNVGKVLAIPEQLTALGPEMVDKLGPMAKEIASKVAEAERKYTDKLDEAESRKGWIVAGAIIGGLIAAPFTGGASLAGAIGIIGLGVGIGMAIPSLTFAVQDYYRIKNDPNADPKDVDKAFWHMVREIGFNVAMLLPVVGYAGRAWAVGQGMFRLARVGYTLEVVGGLGMLGFGGYQMYEGIQMIRKGDTGWGVFNVATAGLFMFGGTMSAINGMRSWGAVGRLSAASVAPDAIAKDIAAVEEGALAMGKIAAGESMDIPAERISEINAAAKRLKDMIQAGLKLPADQMKIYQTYRALTEVQPGKDIRSITRFSKAVRKGLPISSDDFIEAFSARDRLHALSKIRRLNAAESTALANLEQAAKVQSAADIRTIEAFGKRGGTGQPPGPGEIAGAKAAYDRLALSIEESGTSTKSQLAAMKAYRDSMAEVARARLPLDAQSLAAEVAAMPEAARDSFELARAVVRARLLRGGGPYLSPGESIAGYRLSFGDIEGEIRALGRDNALSGNPQQIMIIKADKAMLSQISSVLGPEGGGMSLAASRYIIRESVLSALSRARGSKAFFVRSVGDEVTIYVMGKDLRSITPDRMNASLEEATAALAKKAVSIEAIPKGPGAGEVFKKWTGSDDPTLFLSSKFSFSEPREFTLMLASDESFLANLASSAGERASLSKISDALHLGPDAIASEIRVPAGVAPAISEAEVRRIAYELAGGEKAFQGLPLMEQSRYISAAQSRVSFQSAEVVEIRFRVNDPEAQRMIKVEMNAAEKGYADMQANSYDGSGLSAFLGNRRANAILSARNQAIESAIAEGLPEGMRIRSFGSSGPIIIEGGTQLERSLVIARIEEGTRSNLSKLAADGEALGLDIQSIRLAIDGPTNYDGIRSGLISKRLGIDPPVTIAALDNGTFMRNFLRGPQGLKDFKHLDTLSESIYNDILNSLPPEVRSRYPNIDEYKTIRELIRGNPSMNDGEGLLVYLKAKNPALYSKFLSFIDEQGGLFVSKARESLGIPSPAALAISFVPQQIRPLHDWTEGEIKAFLGPRIEEQMKSVSGVGRAEITVKKDTITIENELGEHVSAERTIVRVDLYNRNGKIVGFAEREFNPQYYGDGVGYYKRIELDQIIRGQQIPEGLDEIFDSMARESGITRMFLHAEKDGLAYWPKHGYTWLERTSELPHLDRQSSGSLTWVGDRPIVDYTINGKKFDGLFSQWARRNNYSPPPGMTVEGLMRGAGDNLAFYPEEFVRSLPVNMNIQTRFLEWARITGWTDKEGRSAMRFMRYFGNRAQYYPEDFLNSIAKEVPYARPVVIDDLSPLYRGMPSEFSSLKVDPILGRQQVRLLRPLDEVQGSSAGVFLGEMEVDGKQVQVAVKLYKRPPQLSIDKNIERLANLYDKYLKAAARNPGNWIEGDAFTKREVEELTEIFSGMSKPGVDLRQVITNVGEREVWARTRAQVMIDEVENGNTLASLRVRPDVQGGIGPRIYGYVDVGDGNIAFAMERVIGVDRYDITVEQIDRIARLNGLSREQQVESMITGIDEAYRAMLNSGHNAPDLQYAILTRRQYINGRWRSPGEVVIWDPGSLNRVNLAPAELESKALSEIGNERMLIEGTLAGHAYRAASSSPSSAINNADFRSLVLGVTDRKQFDSEALSEFIRVGEGNKAARAQEVTRYISEVSSTDPARARRLFESLHRFEKESGIRIVPDDVRFERIAQWQASGGGYGGALPTFMPADAKLVDPLTAAYEKSDLFRGLDKYQKQSISRSLAIIRLAQQRASAIYGKEIKVYLVGGSVRDLAAGNVPNDLDIVVSQGETIFYQQIKQVYAEFGGTEVKVFKLGINPSDQPGQFAPDVKKVKDMSAEARRRGSLIEVRLLWGPASSYERTGPRLNEVMAYDANTRDLTVNSMYLDVENVQRRGIIDPTKIGMNDVRDNVVRFTEGSKKRFREIIAGGESTVNVVYRLFRAYDIAGRSGAKMEEETKTLIRQLVELSAKNPKLREDLEIGLRRALQEGTGKAPRILRGLQADGLMGLMPSVDAVVNPVLREISTNDYKALLDLVSGNKTISDIEGLVKKSAFNGYLLDMVKKYSAQGGAYNIFAMADGGSLTIDNASSFLASVSVKEAKMVRVLVELEKEKLGPANPQYRMLESMSAALDPLEIRAAEEASIVGAKKSIADGRVAPGDYQVEKGKLRKEIMSQKLAPADD